MSDTDKGYRHTFTNIDVTPRHTPQTEVISHGLIENKQEETEGLDNHPFLPSFDALEQETREHAAPNTDHEGETFEVTESGPLEPTEAESRGPTVNIAGNGDDLLAAVDAEAARAGKPSPFIFKDDLPPVERNTNVYRSNPTETLPVKKGLSTMVIGGGAITLILIILLLILIF